MVNQLYFGDNLKVLREHIADESVDLIYLDPPFNSNATYNVLFKAPDGTQSHAQIEAFDDTWHWTDAAEDAYWQVLRGPNSDVAKMLEAMRSFLGENDMMAYLSMMAIRMIELHRVLKPTGSLYLHCDPTASHYLKILLDAVFGAGHLRNEVIWKRTTAHSSAQRWAPVHDTLLFYGKADKALWNAPRTDYDPEYLDKYYRYDDGDGRLYWRDNLCAAGVRKGESGKTWRGFDVSAKGMHWKYTVSKLDELDSQNRIYWPSGGGGGLSTSATATS